MANRDARRLEIYAYIAQRINNGYAPTIKEIQGDLHIPSATTVRTDLQFLEDAGLIERTQGKSRTLVMTKYNDDIVSAFSNPVIICELDKSIYDKVNSVLAAEGREVAQVVPELLEVYANEKAERTEQ